LNIPASLIVLSACETAKGRQERGEGVLSFSRSFLNAGASGLLAPVSRVDAEASAVLTGAFLQHVLGTPGEPPSKAMKEARAKLARSTRWRDPYYWSAFVLTSSWE
jgi:CHAT domain-containing protein